MKEGKPKVTYFDADPGDAEKLMRSLQAYGFEVSYYNTSDMDVNKAAEIVRASKPDVGLSTLRWRRINPTILHGLQLALECEEVPFVFISADMGFVAVTSLYGVFSEPGLSHVSAAIRAALRTAVVG